MIGMNWICIQKVYKSIYSSGPSDLLLEAILFVNIIRMIMKIKNQIQLIIQIHIIILQIMLVLYADYTKQKLYTKTAIMLYFSVFILYYITT